MNTVFVILAVFLVAGCGEDDLYDYSSPMGTYETYREQAKTLRIVADHRHYRRAIRCFTVEDRRWFEKNYDIIDFDREEHIYENLYKSKKKAYVFGRAVVPEGPPPEEDDFEFEEVSSDEYRLQVSGYPEEIKFIRENGEWRMSGLFGVPENHTSD